MATTSPDNLYSPDSVNPYNLTVDLAAMQTSVQAALVNRPSNYRIMTDAQRIALSGANLFEGLVVWTSDTRREWRYTNTTWVPSDTLWSALPLSNGWVNFGSVYGNARYRKIDGVVWVTGMIKSGTTSPGGIIATLPAGFRPASYLMRSVAVSGGVGQVDVTPAGTILHGMSVSSTWTSLEISFPAAV